MKLRNILIVIMKSMMANFALILTFTAVVVVYVLMRSAAKKDKQRNREQTCHCGD